MRLRLVGTIVTLAAVCWSSGCCHRHHFLRHRFACANSCGCVEMTAYAPAPACGCGCGSGPPAVVTSMAPPLAPPLATSGPLPEAMAPGAGPHSYSIPPR